MHGTEALRITRPSLAGRKTRMKTQPGEFGTLHSRKRMGEGSYLHFIPLTSREQQKVTQQSIAELTLKAAGANVWSAGKSLYLSGSYGKHVHNCWERKIYPTKTGKIEGNVISVRSWLGVVVM
jgi:hypothetical protein